MRDADLFAVTYQLVLTDNERHHLRRPIAGASARAHDKSSVQWGGHQTLGYELQQRESHGRLTVTDLELERAYTYAWAYGDGTWQQRFRAILSAAIRAGWRVPATLRTEIEQRRQAVFARGHQSRRHRARPT